MTETVENMSGYDVIFVGYPIWWDTAPMAVFTFMEAYDLSGKTVIPFCTSGGSDIKDSLASLRKLAPKADIKEGLTANSENTVVPWLKKLGWN